MASKPSDALAQFAAQVKAGVPLAVDRAAVVLKAQIQQELSQQGTGRFYVARGAKRGLAKARAAAKALNAGGDVASIGRTITRLHRASAPGKPPAPDTGTLKRSAYIEAIPAGRRVGVATAYAVPLEFGTPRMAARPFMRPALAKAAAAMGVKFAAILNKPGAPGAPTP